MEIRTEQVARFLDQHRTDATETNIEQMMMLLRAFAIFEGRNEKYGDLWKEFSPEANLVHIKSKLMRLERLSGAEAMDDGLDLINYTVFYLRRFNV